MAACRRGRDNGEDVAGNFVDEEELVKEEYDYLRKVREQQDWRDEEASFCFSENRSDLESSSCLK